MFVPRECANKHHPGPSPRRLRRSTKGLDKTTEDFAWITDAEFGLCSLVLLIVRGKVIEVGWSLWRNCYMASCGVRPTGLPHSWLTARAFRTTAERGRRRIWGVWERPEEAGAHECRGAAAEMWLVMRLHGLFFGFRFTENLIPFWNRSCLFQPHMFLRLGWFFCPRL